jgi:hypothetical protein
MSKKSRRRNKTLLAIAGLAGAAALANRKPKQSSTEEDSGNRGDGPAAIARRNANKTTTAKKDTTPKDTTPKDTTPKDTQPKGSNVRTRQRIVDSAGNTVASAGTAVADNKSKVTDVTRPGENMYSTSAGTSNPRAPRAKGGRAGYKHGGSTGSSKSYGAAKRGISPILMKGRK